MSKLFLSLPPFSFELNTNCDLVNSNISRLYPYSILSTPPEVTDYQVSVNRPFGLRSLFKPQSVFSCDQQEVFNPLPYNHAFASFEWGLNWVVSAHELQYVIVHAAVLEKNGKAIMFPAPPGSGKSTLTAYLAFNGWRLLSDEMTLILPYSNQVHPFVRPICLKNRSVDIAKEWFPNGQFSTVAENTHKGDVIHLSPPKDSWLNNTKLAPLCAIIFPQYSSDATTSIEELNQTQAFMELAGNAFNFAVIGDTGFNTLTKVIEQVHSAKATYSDLSELIDYLEQLTL